MEQDILTTVLQVVDAFMSLGVMGVFVSLFLQGRILPKIVVDAERARDSNADTKVETLYALIIAEKDKRIASLEAQLLEKSQQAATTLTLIQAYQGAQDQAARTARGLMQGASDD